MSLLLRRFPGADLPWTRLGRGPTPVREIDGFWLKDESLEDSSKLPDPHVLAGEIAEHLRSALEQIESVLGDLQQRSSSDVAAGDSRSASRSLAD